MRRGWRHGLMALAALTGGGAVAQDAPAPVVLAPQTVQSPVLTLDRDKLFRETLYGKAVEARFKAASDALVAENLRLETALEAEERDLTDRRPKLPATEFQKLAAAFDTKAEQIRAAQEAKSRSLTATREADQQRFLDAAVPVLGDLMRDSGAAAIFDKQLIIISLRGIDITDAAIARIDAVLGDGSTPPAGQTPAPVASPDPSPDPSLDPSPGPTPQP